MKKILMLLVAGLVLSTSALAATTATNNNTVSPTLTISATIQKAVSLTLSTGTQAGVASHCSVVAGADYTMDFGTVDALAINAGNCNRIAPVTPGSTAAIYWTDYKLTPMFTSQATANNATVKAYVSGNFGGSNVAVVRSATANSSTIPVLATDFAPMSTASATPDTLATTTDVGAGGTALTRFIGISVAPTSGAGILTGAGSATVTFTLTAN